MRNPILAVWTDSSLYGSEGGIIENDEDLKGYEKHKIFSQGGAFLALMPLDSLDDVNDVPLVLVTGRRQQAGE